MSALSDITTFARTGTATFVDSDGVLQTAADGVPRTAHHLWDGSAWVNAGLLFESEARTNLLLRSEEFDNASWSKTASTITANAATSPSGALTAEKFVENTANSQHFMSQTFTAAVASYTMTIYAKASERDFVVLSMGGSPFSGAANEVWFDLSNGTVSLNSGADSASIENAGDGWYRCSSTKLSVASGTATAFYKIANSSGVNSYLGDGSSGVFVWGAQLEAASTPSSYIPTTGTTATRNAETLTIAAADAPWSGTAVSIQMEGTVTFADDGRTTDFVDWRLDSSNRLGQSMISSGGVSFFQVAAGVVDTSNSTGDYSPGVNVPFNIASRHGTTFINGAVDGTALTANLTPTALPDLSASNVSVGFDFMGTIKLFRIWAEDIGDVGIASAST